MKKPLSLVIVLSAVLIVATYGVLRAGCLYYGPSVLAMSLFPLTGAVLARLKLKRLLPDILFGVIDTGLLTVAALIGAVGMPLNPIPGCSS